MNVPPINRYTCVFNPFPNNKFQTSKLKECAEDNFKFDESGGNFSESLENTVGKENISSYKQFLLFSLFLKDLYCRHAVTWACLGTGLKDRKHNGLRENAGNQHFLHFPLFFF